MSAVKNAARDVVFGEIVKNAAANPAFRAVVDRMGMFTFMDLVDGILDAVTVALPSLADAERAERGARFTARREVADELRRMADNLEKRPPPP